MSFVGSFKRNVLTSWGTHVSGLLIGIFMTRFMLDALGVSSYSSWLLINSLTGYAGLLYCGLGETVCRYVAKYQSEGNFARLNQLLSVILAVYLVMGSIAFMLAGVLCLTAHYWGGWTGDGLWEARITILILGLNVMIGMVGSVFGGVLLGLRRFDLERGIGFAFELVRVGLFLLFLRQQNGLVIISAIYFLVTVGENLSYYVLSWKLLPSLSIKLSQLDRSVFRECGSFSLMSFLNACANQVINATDTITIGLLMGKEAIVAYYFGLRIAQLVKQPIDKIAHICMPSASALQGQEDQSRRNRFLIKSLGIVHLLTGAAFIGGWYFGEDVLRLWLGPKLDSSQLTLAHHAMVILLGAQLASLPCGILRAFLFGSGHVRVPVLIYLAEAAANLTLSIILCLNFGPEGVAWGTAIPIVCLELTLLVPYALRQMQISLRRVLLQAVVPQLLPLLLLLIYSQAAATLIHSQRDWLGLSSIAISSLAILGAAVWVRQRIDQARLGTA